MKAAQALADYATAPGDSTTLGRAATTFFEGAIAALTSKTEGFRDLAIANTTVGGKPATNGRDAQIAALANFPGDAQAFKIECEARGYNGP